jgi:hypothetical protein
MKVLIGTPYYRTVYPPFVTSLLQMIVASYNLIDCAHMFIQGTNASRQRNLLARTAIRDGYISQHGRSDDFNRGINRCA